MRRILFLALGCLLWLTSSAQAAATLKQVVGTCTALGTNNCTITPSVAITSGDALVMVIGTTPSSNTLTSITATGHTFTTLDTIGTASSSTVMSAYECNAAAGSPTFTITVSVSGGYAAALYEVQGNATSACVEDHRGAIQTTPGTGANGVTTGLTTAVTHNGVFFIGEAYTTCCTPPTISAGTSVAWTDLQTFNDSGGSSTFASEEFAQTTAANLAATFTESASIKTASLIIGIAPSGGAGGGAQSPGLLLLGVGGRPDPPMGRPRRW